MCERSPRRQKSRRRFFLICIKEKDFPLGGKFLRRSRTVIGFRDSDYTAADKKFSLHPQTN